ncbi:hypothetical protein [Clostridium baratii]|uniref:hypothetical protein n=1 Tax=Clostridium baratii TaxID=1561 RepID=UPI0005F2ED89|nr:hypothetical protein [Clostridium baratii]AQM58583.1 hypothetical protein NPD11_3021 [Clostridium baratii]KJU71539.1 hypothetical protein UC77_08985 [Clostridium baratii]
MDWKKAINSLNQDNIDDFDLSDIKDNSLREIPGSAARFFIKFSYETKRKNKKERVIFVYSLNKQDAAKDFRIWLAGFNERNPIRPMLNAKILGISEDKKFRFKIA